MGYYYQAETRGKFHGDDQKQANQEKVEIGGQNAEVGGGLKVENKDQKQERDTN